MFASSPRPDALPDIPLLFLRIETQEDDYPLSDSLVCEYFVALAGTEVLIVVYPVSIHERPDPDSRYRFKTRSTTSRADSNTEDMKQEIAYLQAPLKVARYLEHFVNKCNELV